MSSLQGSRVEVKEREKERVGEDEQTERSEGGRQSLRALVQDGVSMATWAGYQKIEAPSVFLSARCSLVHTHSRPPLDFCVFCF